MNKTILCWQMMGLVFATIAGTVLHFLFAWSGSNVAVALLSAVNESIWEHMKLLFYPMTAFALMEYFAWGKEQRNFWCIKLAGILLGLALIPVLYYTYTGILGTSAHWFNITIFFLVAGVVYWVETKLFQKGCTCLIGTGLTVALICLLVVVFTIFTFLPPRIPLFQDPISGMYGFIKGE